VVGEKWNSKILVNLPVTNVPRCVSRNAKTHWLQHLQIPYIAAGSVHPDLACIVHHRTDKPLVKQHTVSDEQATSPIKEGPSTPNLWGSFLPTWLACAGQVSRVSRVTTRHVLFRRTVLALRKSGLAWAFDQVKVTLQLTVSQSVCHVVESLLGFITRPGFWNQPTKKLTKGGVLRKRHTSSLARFDHSCVRNALLEMVKGALKLQRGVCLRKRDIRRGGRPWLFQTRGCCYWWEIVPSGNVPFVKNILVGWLSEVWTQKYWDRFGWWPLRLGGKSLQLKASMIGEGGPCPFFN
jgi:hypothetical protein